MNQKKRIPWGNRGRGRLGVVAAGKEAEHVRGTHLFGLQLSGIPLG